MRINLKNRVRQMVLGKDQALRPVYEAVANAFDAINEKPPGKRVGTITVRLIRSPSPYQNSLNGEKPLGPVSGFEVVDTGVGFTDDNYKSFNEGYSDRKASLGGKGIGRLLWLKAFESVEVHSMYFDQAGKRAERHFAFDTDCGVRELANVAHGHEVGTTVQLRQLKSDYRCPLSAARIARHIVEHNIEELLASENVGLLLDCPDEGRIDLRELFRTEFTMDSKKVWITVNGRKFCLRHFRVRAGGEVDSHKVAWCAKNRCVRDENLSRLIGDLKEALKGEDEGSPYFYMGTLSGDFFDEAVNDVRTSIDVSEEPNLTGDPSRSQIMTAVAAKVVDYLKSELAALRSQKLAMIRGVVNKTAPELRAVAERHPHLVDEISITSSDIDVLKALSAQRMKDREDYRRLQKELLKSAQAGERVVAAKAHLVEKFTGEANYEATIALVDYVCQRRSVLDVLDAIIGDDGAGGFHKEEAVHQIIFPLRKTSDEVPPEVTNLWLLDERLAFHHYLASDKQFDTLDPLSNDSSKEPDLIVFHHAFATAEVQHYPQTITIVEFKRPGRKAYDWTENPYEQIKLYVNTILDGKAKNRKGQLFSVPPNTRFYAYIVADLPEKLQKILTREGFLETPEPGGMFKHDDGIHLYTEVISYQKLLSDATRRNRAFFDRLGLS